MDKKTLTSILVVSTAAVVCAGIVYAVRQEGIVQKTASNTQAMAPLVVNDSAPVGLIGTVVALGTSSVTIEGQPPGNATPVVLTVLVDDKTNITKVGSAPAYATSTAKFTDFKKGMVLSIEAAAALGGIRHAERIIIPLITQ